MRCHRRKNIAAMKCSAHGMEKIALVRDVPDFRLFPGEDHRKHAVVRSDEVLAGHFGQQRPPRRSYARIDHDHMNRLLWKIAIRLRDGECAVGDLVGLHAMADVDQLRRRLDAENHALHDADKMVGEAEVGGESDDWPANAGAGHSLNLHRPSPSLRYS